MLQLIFNLIITILEIICNILVIPILNIIDQYMPNIGNTLTYVGNFFSHIGQYNTFILSYTGLNDTIIIILVAMLVAIIMIPINTHILKMVAKWWETLI